MNVTEIEPFKATKEEINAFRIVSTALLSGFTVTLNCTKFKLAETEDSMPFKPIIVLEDNTILGTDISFEVLLRLAKDLTPEELMIISSTSVLQGL